MSTTIETQCPECKSKFAVEYLRLGAPLSCPSCGTTIVPEIPIGTEYPRTEYEITFADFRQLLNQSEYRDVVGELLSRWFGCEMAGEGEFAVVISKNRDPIDILDLHLHIQTDSEKQRELYRTAMSLWR